MDDAHMDDAIGVKMEGNKWSREQTLNDTTYFAEIKMDDGKWTREQTQILIDTWKKNKAILLNSASSLSEHFRIWKVIASEVNKLSPPKSLQQCKKKFRNIRYICKTAMNNNKQAGSKKHYPMFYSDFVKILSESQRSLFGDKMKYELPNNPDEVIPYYENTNDISIYGKAHSESSRNEFDQADATLSKASNYSNSALGFNSTNSSGQNSGCSDEDDDGSGAMGERFIPTEAEGREMEIADKCTANGVEIVQPEGDALEYTDDDVRTFRKHKHNDVSIMGRSHDVSIMGRSHPPSKRCRSSIAPASSFQGENCRNNSSIRSQTINNDFYPTMASISQDSQHIPTGTNLASAALSKAAGKYEIEKERFLRTNTLKRTHSDSDKNASQICQISPNNLPKGSYGNDISNGNSDKFSNNVSNGNAELFQERFLELQERQMELFNDMLNRHEQFLLRLLQQQREAAEEAQQRDRNFMFKLVEVFLNKQK